MKIKNLNLNHKRVFLRADLNVSLDNKKITNDYRLKAILPTIDFIQSNGGSVILGTHIGRPEAQSRTNFFDENLSTKLLIDWFSDHGYTIAYEIDLQKAAQHLYDPSHILLLENLRFFNGEQQTSLKFAKLLKQCADCYVNDAFGILHRPDTSVTFLAEQFSPENRAFGLLIEKELTTLTQLKENPEQPFIVVLGGNKIKTKIALLDSLLEQPDSKRIRSILIGGMLANAFLKAKNYSVGATTVDQDDVATAHRFLEKAKTYNVTVLLPTDRQVVTSKEKRTPTIYHINKIPEDGHIVDIGPETIKSFSKEIAQAKTIFANGPMGIYETPEFSTGSRKILHAIANSNAYSVIGGGDALAATIEFGLEDKMNFLSTGGGATLAFLASKQSEELPGIRAMLK